MFFNLQTGERVQTMLLGSQCFFNLQCFLINNHLCLHYFTFRRGSVVTNYEAAYQESYTGSTTQIKEDLQKYLGENNNTILDLEIDPEVTVTGRLWTQSTQSQLSFHLYAISIIISSIKKVSGSRIQH